jgi:hypothetical protein
MEEFKVSNIHPMASEPAKAIHVIAKVFDKFKLSKQEEESIAEWVSLIYGKSK